MHLPVKYHKQVMKIHFKVLRAIIIFVLYELESAGKDAMEPI